MSLLKYLFDKKERKHFSQELINKHNDAAERTEQIYKKINSEKKHTKNDFASLNQAS